MKISQFFNFHFYLSVILVIVGSTTPAISRRPKSRWSYLPTLSKIFQRLNA